MGVFRSLILAFLLVGLVQGYGRPMIEDWEPAYSIGANTKGETPQNADPLSLNRLIIAAIKSKNEKAVHQSPQDGNGAEQRKSTWRVGAIIVAGSRRYPLQDVEDRAGVISSSSKFAAVIGAISGNGDVKTDVYTTVQEKNSTDVSGETSGKYKGIEMTKPLVTGSARSRAYNVIDATESNDIPGLDSDSQQDVDQNSGNIVQKKSGRFTIIGDGPTLEQVNGKWRWRPMSNESKSPHKDSQHDLDQNGGNIVQKKSGRFTIIGDGPTLEQVNGKWRWRPMSNESKSPHKDSQHDLDQNSGNIVQKKSARFTVIGDGPTLEQVNGKWRWRPMPDESKSPHKDKESVATGGFPLKKFNSRPDSDSLRYAPLNSPLKSRLESYLKRRITKLVKENSYIFEKPEWQNTKKRGQTR